MCTETSDARFRLDHEVYDLAILDGNLPGAIGLLKSARSRDPVLPIFVALACDDAPEARVLCLDLGADDCIDRSVHMNEAEARIRALLRRSRNKQPILVCGDLRFNTNSRLFWVKDKTLLLPSKEHAILEALITRPGFMHTKRELANTLYTLNDVTPEGAVRLYIHRLRKRLYGAGADIETHRGIGYLLRPECSPAIPEPA